jgi:hypothetical protein
MGYGTMLFQYLTERKRAKTQQSQWEREQQLREQMQAMQKEQFGLEKQKSEQETARWAPGGMTKPEPFLGPYGPVKMTPREIPEGPEYKRTRLESELAQKQVGGYMAPGELEKLRFNLGEQAGAQKEAAGQRERIDLLQQQLAEEARTREFERETAKTGHGYRMEEIGAGMKPPKEAEEPLIKTDGTVNIKHFFDTANTLFKDFTFYDLTDPKMIENAKKKIYDIVISRFAPTAAEQGLVSSALDQWFESLFQLASKMSDEEKRKPIDWMEFLKRYGKSVGTALIPGMGPAMAAAQYLAPSVSNVQGAPPSGMNVPQREGLLKRGLKKAKSLLGF